MTDTMPAEELEAMANIEIGEVLRRTRIHYGQTLEDIERALRIRGCQIDAIEKGDMSELPGRVYAIGFVRTYAEYLGLDGGKVVQLFKAQYMDNQGSSLLSFPIPASETQTPSVLLIFFCFFGAFLFFSNTYQAHEAKYSTPLTVIDVPEEIRYHVTRDILETTQPDKLKQEVVVMEPEKVVVEDMRDNETQKTGIILNIINNSWVEIKNGQGEIIVSNILEKGDQYFVPDSPGMSMSLGNAANVEIILNGRPLKPLGKDGDVRRDIPLDTSFLQTLEFQDDLVQEN